MVLVSFIVLLSSHAQVDSINEFTRVPEQVPVFVAGSSNLQQDILSIFNTDSLKMFGCEDSELILSIKVDTNGNVNDVLLIRGQCESLFDYLTKILKEQSFYKPAMNFGHPVECQIPIKIGSFYYRE